jgi:hypothetical protein
MKEILQKIALFFGLLALPVVLLFALPYSTEFARHFIKDDCYNHGAWIFDRLTKNETPIDIAFIGSSHTIHSFQEKKMETLLENRFHLANLGYCRFGRNLEYLFIKELVASKRPQLVVIEVHEDEPKNSHDIFPYLADTKDLLISPTFVNRDYFSDVFNGASARLEQFKAKYIFREKYPEPDLNPYGYGESDRIATEEEFLKNKQGWSKWIKRRGSLEIEQIQLKYPYSYLLKTINLLKSRNIPFVFVYLPESGSNFQNPLRLDFYKQYGQVLTLPDSIVNSPTNWMDDMHFNDRGASQVSEWMAKKMKQILDEKCLNERID